jgi:hypothetical protein
MMTKVPVEATHAEGHEAVMCNVLATAGHSSTLLPDFVGALEGIARRWGGPRPLEEISRAWSTSICRLASTTILAGCSAEEDPR